MQLNFNDPFCRPRTSNKTAMFRAGASIFKTCAPLVAVLIIGCSTRAIKDESGVSIKGLNTAQIEAKHSDIVKSQYKVDTPKIDVKTVDEICITNCGNPEDGDGIFNYSQRAVIVDLSEGSRYHNYAYTEDGERLWEGMGNGARRVYVMRDKDNRIKALKAVERQGRGWVERDMINEKGVRAQELWQRTLVQAYNHTPTAIYSR